LRAPGCQRHCSSGNGRTQGDAPTPKSEKKFCKGTCEEKRELLYNHDTFDRSIQLGASRERLKDAQALHNNNRCTGAIYLAGYAIECSLKALVCYYELKSNFKDTKIFKRGVQGASLHNLHYLRQELPLFHRSIINDRTGIYKNAWNVITDNWHKDELRYWNKSVHKDLSEKFLASVKKMHELILRLQGESA
jgi:hypothetical protein